MSNRSLEIKGLNKNFHVGSIFLGKRIHAVENASFSMNREEPWILSIVGESGCGKTTLARMLLRLLSPSSGTIMLNGEPLSHFASGNKRAFYKRVQMIAQNPFSAFNPRRMVESYLFETAHNLTDCKTRESALALIEDMLNTVGMEYSQIKGKYPNQFSGGELQRISVVRAMLPRPELIIADEPVAMIDASLRMNIVNTFKLLKENYKTNFVYITHDLSTAYYVSDFVAIMYRGNIIEFGPAEKVFTERSHPYTDLLISSIPTVGEKWEEGLALPEMESKEYLRKGCKLTKRCPYAQDICRRVFPAETAIDDTHRVACHKYSGFAEPAAPPQKA